MQETKSEFYASNYECILAILWISGGEPAKRLQKRFGYVLEDLSSAFDEELTRRIDAGEATVYRRGDEQLLVHGAERDTTLRSIAELYLHDEAAPEWDRKMLKGALRFWFGLPGTSTLEQILAACETIPASELYQLPQALYERALAVPRKVKAAILFRTSLRSAMAWAAERIPLSIVVPMAWCEIEGEVTRRMVEALAEVWATGREPGKANLREAGGPNPGSVQLRMEQLEASGRVAFRPHEKRGTSLLWVNLTDQEVDDATLRDAVEAYLEREEHSSRQKRGLLTALRVHLELDAYSDRRRVLQACESVPCRELHGLAAEARTRFRAEGLPKKRIRTMASAIRNCLRWAAAARVVPMVFRDPREDVWQSVKRAWIPAGPGKIGGVSRATRYGHRTAWGWFEVAVKALRGEDIHPEDLTSKDAEAAIVWTKERGRYDHAGAISAMLNWLARQGHGPRAGMEVAVTGDPLLKGPEGDGCADYDRFLAALKHNGLPDGWLEFFRWYRDFSTEPWEVLALQLTEEGARRFPDRAPGRQLKANTLYARTKAVRWMLGISKDFLGVDLSELTLERAFSEQHLRRVYAEGQMAWKARYKAGDLSSPFGTSIQQYVIGTGLVAEALYELRRHQRGHRVALDESKTRRRGVIAAQEEGAVRSADEESFWRGYLHSRRVAGNLKESAERFGDAPNKNTQKDLAEIIRLTPPDWYWDTHHAALNLAKRSLAEDGESEEHHRLIRDVYAFGTLLSAGLRGAELALLRLDVQYPEHEWSKGGGDRRILLHKDDRKNERGHTCVIREVFVPGWLEAAYIHESRPWLMRDLSSAEGAFGLTREQQHHHVIVDNKGRALGAVEEHADRSNRDERAVETRVNWLRDTLKNRFGRIAWDHCGRKCPTGDGQFTLHTVRNVMGYFLYHRAQVSGDAHPALAAANYLGDAPSMVQDVYGGIDGTLVRTDFEQMGEWGRMASTPAPGTTPGVESSKIDQTKDISLFDALAKAREEVVTSGREWGLSEEEIERIWQDRRRRIMEESAA